jgi:HSP20 family protein
MATAAAKTTAPRIIEPDSLFNRIGNLHQSIAKRAYELFEARGGEQGQDLEDWLRAESELLQFVPIEMVESDDELTLQARVPGFSAEDIQISVEPCRLMISGRKEHNTEDRAGDANYTEQSCKEIFQAVDLPIKIDSNNAMAKIKKGLLSIRLPKATA